MKASWRCLEDIVHLRLQKMFSRRLQDEYICLSHTSLLQDVFKTSWSRPIYSSWSYVFKTSSRRLAKTSSRHLQICHWGADFQKQPFTDVFSKIGVLKNFTILEPLSNKVVGLLLHNTYGGCVWIFAVANTFFQLNLVFIADSCTGFCLGLLWKHELYLRSSHWSCSVKKVFLEILQISQENTCVKASFKKLQHRYLPVEFTKFLRTTNLKTANNCFWNLFFHLECPF